MANQIPIKVMCDGSGNTCGLAQFTSSDSVAVAAGGTGLTTQGICAFAQPGIQAVACKTTYIGICAGKSEGAADENTYVGYAAGQNVTTGCYHTIIGSNAGDAITTCSSSTLIGYNAGTAITFGDRNTAVGTSAGQAITTATDNTLVGYISGCVTTGASNTTLGACTLAVNTVGVDNVAIGMSAGKAQVAAGCNNTFVGSQAGEAVLCRDNTLMGAYAGTAATTGGGNTMIGACVGYGVVGGASNVYIGDKAGLANTSGNANVFIGNCAGCAATGSCCLIIGNGACDLITGDFNGGTVFVPGKVGIGTSPDNCLHLYSSSANEPLIRIDNANADANGAQLRFCKKGGSPADGDTLGKIQFWGDDSGGASTQFADLYAQSDDVTDGTEDGSITFRTMKAGTLTGTLNMASGMVGVGLNAAPSTYANGNAALVVGDTGDAVSEITIGSSTSGTGELNFTDTANTTNQGSIQYLHSSDAMTLQTGATERMRIDSSGNVGIGSASPNKTLDVFDGSSAGNNVAAMFRTNFSGTADQGVNIDFADTTPTTYGRIGAINHGTSRRALVFSTYGSGGLSEVVRFEGDGSVGIGTAAPDSLLHLETAAVATAKLHIETTATDGCAIIQLRNDATAWDIMAPHGGLSDSFRISSHVAGCALTFTTDGKLGIGTSSPESTLTVDGDLAVFRASNSSDRRFFVDESTGKSIFSQDSGSEAPLGLLHLFQSDSGSTVDATSDALILEDAADVGMTFMSGSTSYARMMFTDSNGTPGQIRYKHSTDNTDTLTFKVGDTEGVTFADGGLVGIGTSSPDTLLHLKSSGSGEPKIKIENTNADQHQGMIHFYKTGSSPADADAIGSVAFYADNSADEETLFGDIKSYTDDVTDGTEDGSIKFRTITAGTLTDTMSLVSGNVGIGTNSPSTDLEIMGPAADFGYLTLSTAETTIVNTDPLGRIDFKAPLEASGSNAVLPTVRLEARAAETFDATHNQTDLLFLLASDGGVTEKIRITSAGNVGIGTSAPFTKLSLVTTDNTGLDTTNLDAGSNENTLFLNNSSSTNGTGSAILARGNNTNAAIGFLYKCSDHSEIWFSAECGGVHCEKMRIDSGGCVGIGTATPAAKLDVRGAFCSSAHAYACNFSVTSAAGHAGIWICGTGGNCDNGASLCFSTLCCRGGSIDILGLNSSSGTSIMRFTVNGCGSAEYCAICLSGQNSGAQIDMMGCRLGIGNTCTCITSTYFNFGPSTARIGIGTACANTSSKMHLYGAGNNFYLTDGACLVLCATSTNCHNDKVVQGSGVYRHQCQTMQCFGAETSMPVLRDLGISANGTAFCNFQLVGITNCATCYGYCGVTACNIAGGFGVDIGCCSGAYSAVCRALTIGPGYTCATKSLYAEGNISNLGADSSFGARGNPTAWKVICWTIEVGCTCTYQFGAVEYSAFYQADVHGVSGTSAAISCSMLLANYGSGSGGAWAPMLCLHIGKSGGGCTGALVDCCTIRVCFTGCTCPYLTVHNCACCTGAAGYPCGIGAGATVTVYIALRNRGGNGSAQCCYNNP